MVRVEEALDQQETVVGVFLDIEGAFNTSTTTQFVQLLLNMGSITLTYG